MMTRLYSSTVLGVDGVEVEVRDDRIVDQC